MRTRILAALVFVAASILGATPSVAWGHVDYVIEEDPVDVPEWLQFISVGSTVGSGGVHYFPLRVHCASNLPATDCQGYYNLLLSKLNVPYEVSSINARFVLEGPLSSPVDSSQGSLLETYNAYKAWYPADGRFGMLLVPDGDGIADGWAGVTNPVPGVLLRSVVSVRGWVFAGRPNDVEFVETPAHETGGHNLGLLHNGCPVGSNMDGCGYVNSHGTSDLMEVNGIYREGQYSDPTVMMDGEPFGDEHANAVRFVNSRLDAYAAVTAPVVAPCEAPEDDIAYVQGGRFRVHVCWRTPQGTSGTGHLVLVTVESAFFWFFNQNNYELLLKVKNACIPEFGDVYWVFAAGLTNVEVTITVVDSFTGLSKTYLNPIGQAFLPVQDTGAFSCDH